MKIKYKSIYEEIKRRLENHEYKIGERLPDELTLCKVFGVSRMTIKKACDQLVAEGYIYRRQGQGTFVLSRKADVMRVEIQDRELSGFTRASQGKCTSLILRFGLIFAPQEVASRLIIAENEPVYDILRVRLLNGIPYVIEQTYMSPALIPGITQSVLEKSLYSYIEQELGLRIASAQKISRADVSNELDHRELDLKWYKPVMEVEQTAFLENGTPFKYSISRHRYDKFHFSSYSSRQ